MAFLVVALAAFSLNAASPATPDTRVDDPRVEAGLIALSATLNAGDDAGTYRLYSALPDYIREDPGAVILAARALSSLERQADAATLLRGALVSRPADARLHAELGRVYFEMGRHAQSRRAFERAATDPSLSPAIRSGVERYLDAIEQNLATRWHFSVAIAPDTNINAATDARTVDFLGLPLNLSETARERSGIGVSYEGSIAARHGAGWLNADFWQLTLGLDGEEYDGSRFDTASVRIGVGPRRVVANEWLIGTEIVDTEIWLGNRHAARATGLAGFLSWQPRPVWRVDLKAEVRAYDEEASDRRDGPETTLLAALTHTPAPDRFARMSAVMQVRDAEQPDESFAYLRLAPAYFREWGWGTGVLVEPFASWRRHEAGNLVFPESREDIEGGLRVRVSKRDWGWRGLNPFVSTLLTVRESTHPLYDETRRARVEFGFLRSF